MVAGRPLVLHAAVDAVVRARHRPAIGFQSGGVLADPKQRHQRHADASPPSLPSQPLQPSDRLQENRRMAVLADAELGSIESPSLMAMPLVD
jgi:hypothetical protein